ncbi:MAG: response regulator [Alphaproteobacteria bacterium]|nr:response regulator [Alphaproteobacteria bacterium]
MARILLVEDEDLLRESLVLALSGAGHSVTDVADGQKALKAFETAQFDIVVTDILMPVTDGLELTRLLRKARQGLYIIAISGGGRTRNMDMLGYAKSFGADTVLAKPFLPKDLIALVDAAAARSP